MRKYVVPIVALMGIALLSPRSDAANLIIKSRLGVPGRPVSVPIAVTGVGNNGQLWGLDFALKFDTAKLSVGTDPGGNGTAFTPMATNPTTPEVPVVVTGTTAQFVGTPASANPDVYVGIVRGTGPFTTTATSNAPTWSIGLLRLNVAAGDTVGEVVDLAVPANYPVANDGTGSTTVSRLGATAATSDTAAGSAVSNDPVVVLDTAPGPGAIHVPLHKIAIGLKPGDVQLATGAGAGKINSGDLSVIKTIILQKRPGTPYELIAADVNNPNNYVPGTSYGGTNGLSYGDGRIDSGDLSQIQKFILQTAVNFPVSE